MKAFLTSFALLLTVGAFAGSGIDAVKIVLDQPEVEKLELGLREKGFTLTKIQDVFATRGVYPRCPCTSLELTFSKVSGGKSEDKVYGVRTEGFGTNLEVTVQPVKN